MCDLEGERDGFMSFRHACFSQQDSKRCALRAEFLQTEEQTAEWDKLAGRRWIGHCWVKPEVGTSSTNTAHVNSERLFFKEIWSFGRD